MASTKGRQIDRGSPRTEEVKRKTRRRLSQNLRALPGLSDFSVEFSISFLDIIKELILLSSRGRSERFSFRFRRAHLFQDNLSSLSIVLSFFFFSNF